MIILKVLPVIIIFKKRKRLFYNCRNFFLSHLSSLPAACVIFLVSILLILYFPEDLYVLLFLLD